MASVLAATKEMLGIPSSVTDFDLQIVTQINGAVTSAKTLGITLCSYSVESDTEMEDLTSDEDLWHLLQMYIYTKVRLTFDPPSVASVLNALQSTISEYEWRLNNYALE